MATDAPASPALDDDQWCGTLCAPGLGGVVADRALLLDLDHRESRSRELDRVLHDRGEIPRDLLDE